MASVSLAASTFGTAVASAPFLSTTSGDSLVAAAAKSTNARSSGDRKYRVFLAVGSNLGDRYCNIRTALQLLCNSSDTKLMRTSFWHETAPMYVTDQPSFLNGAVSLQTNLEPHDLLQTIKTIEAQVGRDLSAMRNGPRPVDLDILLYERRLSPSTANAESHASWEPRLVDTNDLVVPHSRITEREFVLAPLCEVAGPDLEHPVRKTSVRKLLEELRHEMEENKEPTVRVIPLPRSRMLYFNETLIMGVLNVTPNSFSDGGKWEDSTRNAVERALEMEQQGAHIVDIGGESTRPGADDVSAEEELRRTIPVIEGIRESTWVVTYIARIFRLASSSPFLYVILFSCFLLATGSEVAISIDTRKSVVARAAVNAGADIVNDVSGGTFDDLMLSTVAELGVPIVLMHMRGTPKTMQSMTEYEDVVADVARTLMERSQAAECAGIPRWIQILDPGIGFAKDQRQNLLLLKDMLRLRALTDELPILIGTSRKGFIGKITGVSRAEDRDVGSVASFISALSFGSRSKSCDIVRVHNVEAARHAALVLDAIKQVR
jgi:dihydropteroate synthase/2-amino-4-hydroxy-6-hydroxymethyldihydropteridine diphosphokinase